LRGPAIIHEGTIFENLQMLEEGGVVVRGPSKESRSRRRKEEEEEEED
jgi:hypothetical protein